jgi:O-antigen/teichoic acid export membrane protein
MKSVWALVIGKITGEIARLIASYILSSYRPHFEFNLHKFHNLHSFGRWVSGVNIVTYIVTQGDSIIVGRIFGPASLGIYKLGSTIANMPTTEITSVISQVAFPAYAKIQDNLERLRSSFLKTLFFTGILSSLLTSLIYVFIPDFTMVFLGEKWLYIIPIVQILVIAGFVRSLTAIPGPLFQAIGKPHLDTYSQVVRLTGLLIPIYPLCKAFGLIGVAYSVLISIVCMSFYSFIYSIKIFNLKINLLLKTLLTPVILGLALILIITFFGHYLNRGPLINLVVLVPLSFVTFLGMIILREYLNPEYKLSSFFSNLLNVKTKI